jgi:hypothetical protein
MLAMARERLPEVTELLSTLWTRPDRPPSVKDEIGAEPADSGKGGQGLETKPVLDRDEKKQSWHRQEKRKEHRSPNASVLLPLFQIRHVPPPNGSRLSCGLRTPQTR